MFKRYSRVGGGVMKAYYFYYENGSYSKKFISSNKEKLICYREKLTDKKDKCKKVGEIIEICIGADDIVTI